MENKLLDFSFDHYTIEVSDLEKSLFFYNHVLGFPIISRPAFDFEGSWLSIGNGQALHLIVNNDKINIQSGSRKLHFAFSHYDVEALKKFFIQFENIKTLDIKIRPDGIKQLFIIDPDGYYIEFCENKK